MIGVLDGYFGDPRALRDRSTAIRRIGDDVGLQGSLIRRAGESAALATGDGTLETAVLTATSHLVMAVGSTSRTLHDVGRFGHIQAAALLRAFGEEGA